MPEQSLAAEGLKAKRRLLRDQTRRLSERLPWLSDPGRIPASAVPDPGVERGRAFAALATWMLSELVSAADAVRDELPWAETFARHRLPPDVEDRVLRAVLEPASRHAPGLFALAEIMAAVPAVARRHGAKPSALGLIARRSQRLGMLLSRSGSDLQVVLRRYLRSGGSSGDWHSFGLNPARLSLDSRIGVTTAVPAAQLIERARHSVRMHIGPHALNGTCVALAALAPDGRSVFSALWTAYAAAAEGLIFPRLQAGAVPKQLAHDEDFAGAIDSIAKARAAELGDALPARSWADARRVIYCPEAAACSAEVNPTRALG